MVKDSNKSNNRSLRVIHFKITYIATVKHVNTCTIVHTGYDCGKL